MKRIPLVEPITANPAIICRLIILIFFTLSCSSKKPFIKYERLNHTIQDMNGKTFRSVNLIEKNQLGLRSCTINYYRKLGSSGQSILSLEQPDPNFFTSNNSLNCTLVEGRKYLLEITFRGFRDSIEIIW